VTDALTVLVPLIYAFAILHVIVAFALVLLYIDNASPVEKVALGTVTLPPEPILINCPTSVVANVYDPVLSAPPDCGTFK
jgi:hypothetical protein